MRNSSSLLDKLSKATGRLNVRHKNETGNGQTNKPISGSYTFCSGALLFEFMLI